MLVSDPERHEKRSTELFVKHMALKEKCKGLAILHPRNEDAEGVQHRIQSLASIVQNYPLPLYKRDLMDHRERVKEVLATLRTLGVPMLADELKTLTMETLEYKLTDCLDA